MFQNLKVDITMRKCKAKGRSEIFGKQRSLLDDFSLAYFYTNDINELGQGGTINLVLTTH